MQRKCLSGKRFRKLEGTRKIRKTSSQCHRAASTYEILFPRCPDVAELFDNKEKEARELNRRCFIAILDSIQYLARQGIPLRSHGRFELFPIVNFILFIYSLLKVDKKHTIKYFFTIK